LIVEDGANAFSNDWMLVDDEKPDHVTDIRLGRLEAAVPNAEVVLAGPHTQADSRRRKVPSSGANAATLLSLACTSDTPD